MTDDRYKFHGVGESISDPANDGAAVVKSDTVPLSPIPKYLYVGTAGDLVVKGQGGAAITFKAVPAGTFVPFRAEYVMLASTAADILALY